MNEKIRFFENAKSKNRLSHLYLISGGNGSGKIDLANEFAYIVLKDYIEHENLKENISSRKNSQVYYIEPDGLSIKKEQIINLQNEFSKTSLVKAPRIYIIKDIDLISVSGANSLLKFMEEPENSNVYGLLLTTNISNILPTIISRSQVINLQSITEKRFIDELVQKEVDEVKAINLSFITRDIKEAMILSTANEIDEIISFLEELISNWNNEKYSIHLSVYNKINFITEDKVYYKIFLEMMLNYFLDVLYNSIDQPVRLNHLEKDIIKIKDIDNIKKVVYFIQEEIHKQNYYINISLSLDLLLLMMEKSR